MANLFGSPEWQKLADDNPKEYYENTPFMRSLWEGRLPTWLGQAYEQDISPAIEAAPSPTTMKGALTYGKGAYNLAKGLVTGAVDTIDSAQKDPYDLKKVLDLSLMITGGGGLLGRAPRGSLGANVFQGGPHKYGPKGAAESLQHMGKGEGAQAYGWGRYDAGSREVGEQYKRDLSGFDELTLHTKGGSKRGEALDDVDLDVAKYLGFGASDAGQFPHNTVYYAKKRAEAAGKDAVVKRLDEYGPDARMAYEKNMGYLYKHDLPDDDIARYLDWDKPWREQPKGVLERLDLTRVGRLYATYSTKEAAERTAKSLKDGVAVRSTSPLGGYVVQQIPDNLTGKDIYNAYAREFGATSKDSSEALGRAGIPGLKYYDGMSRNKPLKEIKKSFLTELPEDAGIDEIVELFGKGHFSLDNEAILKALAADDWLGFDSPAQAISAALGKNMNNWDPSERLTKAIAKAREGGTRNYVTWDQEVLDRMKLLERSGKSMIDALR